jgi:hypothetical protein
VTHGRSAPSSNVAAVIRVTEPAVSERGATIPAVMASIPEPHVRKFLRRSVSSISPDWRYNTKCVPHLTVRKADFPTGYPLAAGFEGGAKQWHGPIAKTMPEFIAYAKANPGKLNMASAGNRSASHVAGELFKFMAAVDMAHVPHRAWTPALTDLLAGQVQVLFDVTPSSIRIARGYSELDWSALGLLAAEAAGLDRQSAPPRLTSRQTVPGPVATATRSMAT